MGATPRGSSSAPPFECDVLEPNGEVLVTVRGEVDVTTADELETCLEDVLDAGKHIFLDLADTNFIDGRGLRPIIRAAHRADSLGQVLTVATRSELVAGLLRAAPGAPNISIILV